MAKKSKTRTKIDAAFREVHGNVPSRVKQTKRKFGKERAELQKKAIALDKARRKGARIPKP